MTYVRAWGAGVPPWGLGGGPCPAMAHAGSCDFAPHTARIHSRPLALLLLTAAHGNQGSTSWRGDDTADDDRLASERSKDGLRVATPDGATRILMHAALPPELDLASVMSAMSSSSDLAGLVRG